MTSTAAGCTDNHSCSILQVFSHARTRAHTHTHTRLTALCPGLPWSAGTRTVKPIWILLKQETVSGSGISWAICKSAPRSRQITTPAPTAQFFTGWMPFLPPNQQRQSTEGKRSDIKHNMGKPIQATFEVFLSFFSFRCSDLTYSGHRKLTNRKPEEKF